MRKMFAIVAGLVLSTASAASAANILMSTSPSSSWSFDRGNYATFYSALQNGNTVTSVADMSDAAQVARADALIIATRRSGDILSATEIMNISAFIATGKRVYLGGENTGWQTWNTSILSLVGGQQGGTVTGLQTNQLSHELTDGVATVNVPAGSAGGGGGTSLFSGRFANLWGASQNVLTVQDLNIFQNSYIGREDNSRFGQNVAAWISAENITPVPLPAALPFLLTGLGALGLLARRRRRAG